MLESRLNEHARNEHGRQCCGGEVRLLLEPLPARPIVAVFGVGHVGYELARILSRLEIQLHLVDSRAEQLDQLRLADVTDGTADVSVHHALLGEQVLERLPRGAHVLIMTHDHAEDFALCDAALRLPQPLGSIGLIGSSAKWTRFQAQLADAGHDPAVDRPDHLPDRPARDHRQGAGRDRRRGRRRCCSLQPSRRRWLDGTRPLERRKRGDAVVTLYAATVIDTPGDPFAGDPADALARVRRRAAGPRRRHPRPGPLRRAARRRTPASRSTRAGRRAAACPASSTPTCTTRRSARSAGWACRCSTGWSSARCPRRAGSPSQAYARGGGRGVPRRPARLGHDHARWCSARTSPRPWTSCSPRPSAAA